jgi:hypothetical protein
MSVLFPSPKISFPLLFSTLGDHSMLKV